MMNAFFRKTMLKPLTLDYEGLKKEAIEIKELIDYYESKMKETPEEEQDKIEILYDMQQVLEVTLCYAKEIMQFTELTGESLSEFMRKYEIKYLCDKHIKEMSTR